MYKDDIIAFFLEQMVAECKGVIVLNSDEVTNPNINYVKNLLNFENNGHYFVIRAIYFQEYSQTVPLFSFRGSSAMIYGKDRKNLENRWYVIITNSGCCLQYYPVG